MKKRLWLVNVVLACTAMSAQAASFDCGKASSNVEKMICGDAELSSLDEQLAKTYKASMEGVEDTSSLKKEQKKWLKTRRNICKDAGCLKNEYRVRAEVVKRGALLTIAESHSEMCQRYVDYFNLRNISFSMRSDDLSRVQEYQNDWQNIVGGELPDWQNLKHLKRTEHTAFTDLVEEIITGKVNRDHRDVRKALDFESSNSEFFEATIDINGDGENEHLLRYQSDPEPGLYSSIGDFKNISFVINDEPLGFSLEKNQKLFPKIYNRDFLCHRRNYTDLSDNSLWFAGGVNQFIFKYKALYYYDFVSTKYRDKSNCEGSNYKLPYDLSSKVFIHQVGNTQSVCVLDIHITKGDKE